MKDTSKRLLAGLLIGSLVGFLACYMMLYGEVKGILDSTKEFKQNYAEFNNRTGNGQYYSSGTLIQLISELRGIVERFLNESGV